MSLTYEEYCGLYNRINWLFNFRGSSPEARLRVPFGTITYLQAFSDTAEQMKWILATNDEGHPKDNMLFAQVSGLLEKLRDYEAEPNAQQWQYVLSEIDHCATAMLSINIRYSTFFNQMQK